MIEIKRRFGGRVLYTAAGAQDVRAAVREAVAAKADLSGADLYGRTCAGRTCAGRTCTVIPAAANRHNATGRKCRAEYAQVLALFSSNTGGEIHTAYSTHDPTFPYVVGQIVRPTKPFDVDRWNECAPGIHFFITREEAEAHQ